MSGMRTDPESLKVLGDAQSIDTSKVETQWVKEIPLAIAWLHRRAKMRQADLYAGIDDRFARFNLTTENGKRLARTWLLFMDAENVTLIYRPRY